MAAVDGNCSHNCSYSGSNYDSNISSRGDAEGAEKCDRPTGMDRRLLKQFNTKTNWDIHSNEEGTSRGPEIARSPGLAHQRFLRALRALRALRVK